MHRTTVLATAAKLTAEDRNKTHGDAVEQHTCAEALIQTYNAYTKHKYGACGHDTAIHMALIKISRIACGKPGNEDNYIDGAAYLAIASECWGGLKGEEEAPPVVPAPRKSGKKK
jgi:hypothetical protein